MTDKDLTLMLLKDAIEFFRIMDTTCKKYDSDCGKCQFFNFETGCKIINAHMEEWDKANSPKTRESEFLRMYPHAPKYANGQLDVCPRDLDADFHCPSNAKIDCYECERLYWSEVEHDKS